MNFDPKDGLDASAALGGLAIRGYGLSAGTLAAELGERATLLVFLRHYG